MGGCGSSSFNHVSSRLFSYYNLDFNFISDIYFCTRMPLGPQMFQQTSDTLPQAGNIGGKRNQRKNMQSMLVLP